MKFLQHFAGRLREAITIQVSLGVADADKIASTDANGRFDISLMPAGLLIETKTFVAFEALAAGDFINIFLDAGIAKIRKADASAANASRKADGFVIAAVIAGANGTVYYGNINTGVAGLTIGEDYFLSDAVAGNIVTIASLPVLPGRIIQRVGKAVSATELLVEMDTPIQLS